MKALLDEKAAAPLIGHEVGTIQNWRTRGCGPKFIKGPGKRGKVLYDPDDILAWREAHRVSSTSETVKLAS